MTYLKWLFDFTRRPADGGSGADRCDGANANSQGSTNIHPHSSDSHHEVPNFPDPTAPRSPQSATDRGLSRPAGASSSFPATRTRSIIAPAGLKEEAQAEACCL